jgi:hypothetical protein
MKFCEALDLMKEGKNVVRLSWADSDGYLTFMPGMKHIWKILPYPNPNAGNHILSVEEMDAIDWMVYEEKKPEPELMADAA